MQWTHSASGRALSLHVQQLLQHLVGRGDDLGTGRIGPLGADQIGELGRQVHGRGFQRGGRDVAGPAVARGLEAEAAAVGGQAPGVAACVRRAKLLNNERYR